jgi:hypothetical protein
MADDTMTDDDREGPIDGQRRDNDQRRRGATGRLRTPPT